MIPFDDALRARLDANLRAHERRAEPLDGRRHAAVAIVVLDSDAELHDGDSAYGIDMSAVPGDPRQADGRPLDGRMIGVAGGAAFLLCRRPSKIRRHAGQWALPGGRIDDGVVDGEPRFVAIPESDRPVVRLPLGNDLIHAPTGAWTSPGFVDTRG